MESKLEKLLADSGNRTYSADELAYMSSCFRKTMFDVLHERGTGHWGGASSAAEIITSLYFNRLRIDPRNPKWEDRDRFILSKGHACVNLYTVLASRGFFSTDCLHGFRKLGNMLQGHPTMYKVPGVDMSTGALGHGLSAGVGMALASELSGKGYCTYVLVGEGCLDEGQTWEALLFAAKQKVRNLVLLIDYNKVQLDGTEDQIMPLEPLRDKLTSFGWCVNTESYDGNSTEDILRSFEWLDGSDVWPKAVIYDTVKGKGVSFSEGKSSWHGAVIDDEHYRIGDAELRAEISRREAGI